MARTRPSDRLSQLRDAALRVFGTKGLRRSRMADVAAAMQVSPGSLYNYVESKEALFHWLLERGASDGAFEVPAALPIRSPAPGVLEERLREQLAAGFHLPVFEAALTRRRVTDVRAELEAVLRELYERVETSRRAMTMVERSSLDLPEFFQIYFVSQRRAFFGRFARYVERRQAAGHFRDDVDPVVAARLLLETVTYFARHRFGDPDPGLLPDAAVVRDDVIRLAVAGVLPRAPRP